MDGQPFEKIMGMRVANKKLNLSIMYFKKELQLHFVESQILNSFVKYRVQFSNILFLSGHSYPRVRAANIFKWYNL